MKKTKLFLLVITHFIPSVSFAQTMAGGEAHSLFLCANSTPMACGANTSGELGNGIVYYDTIVPVPVSLLNDIQSIAGNYFHSIFLKSDGTAWACGSNESGDLGDGTIIQRNDPVQIPSLSGITKVAAGQYHSLFLKNDSTVWTCGSNGYGELGKGTFDPNAHPVPTKVISLTGIIAIAGAEAFSLFLKNNGTVWACGINIIGQLGDGTASDRHAPIQVSSVNNIISIAAGRHHSLFLKDDGTVWACGGNGLGQLGDGTAIDRNTPVQVSSLSGIVAIAAGNYHSVFLKNDGTVWACGFNTDGQLGDGTTIQRIDPVQVNTLTGIISIATGGTHSLFQKADGSVWGCGSNANGQLGDGTKMERHSPVQTMALCTVMEVTEKFEDRNLSFKIYPNPCNGVFKLAIDNQELKVKQNSTIIISNLLGEIVFKSVIKNSRSELDLSAQPKGIYFISLCTYSDNPAISELIENQKFIIQ